MKKIIAVGFCIFITFLSIGQETQNSNNAKPSPAILFICEHGAARSTIAAAYFNKLAKAVGFKSTTLLPLAGPTSAAIAFK